MSEIYNIYCDESCHLEHDKQKSMVIGAMWCPKNKSKDFFYQIRDIKLQHNLPAKFEIKWTKVSPAKIAFYLNLVEWFFKCTELNFRAIIIPDKTVLDHAKFLQTHDDWYYKMFFRLLGPLLDKDNTYNIYLDIKDTCSVAKEEKLREFLSHHMHDFSMEAIEKIQAVSSHEIELIQLADLFIGALSYRSRKLKDSEAKIRLINKIEENCQYPLSYTRPKMDKKFNIFYWDINHV